MPGIIDKTAASLVIKETVRAVMGIAQLLLWILCKYAVTYAEKHSWDKSRLFSGNTGYNDNIKDTNLIEWVHAAYYINVPMAVNTPRERDTWPCESSLGLSQAVSIANARLVEEPGSESAR